MAVSGRSRKPCRDFSPRLRFPATGHRRAREERAGANAELCVILGDIDHFKEVNDGYGHHAGDEVLRQLAELFRDALCAGELTCRYGGEEFAFVLVNSDEAQALATAERLRALVEARTFWASDLSGQSVPLNVTLSLGYASFGRGAETCAELVARADQALYAAKGSGRNCVMSSGRALRDPSASSERVRAR